jgi:hypothetical protein
MRSRDGLSASFRPNYQSVVWHDGFRARKTGAPPGLVGSTARRAQGVIEPPFDETPDLIFSFFTPPYAHCACLLS